MAYMFSKDVLHRDLKLANILLHFPTMTGKEDLITKQWLTDVDLETTPFIAKIADLGFALKL
jgi:serine/threonine protein kinase